MTQSTTDIPARSTAEPGSRFRALYAAQIAQSTTTRPEVAALRAAASACRGLLAERWARTQSADAARSRDAGCRRVHYLSMEFLMGRALGNTLDALGLRDALESTLSAQSLSLADVLEAEPDAALGNGGLGRLAACFLDAFAEQGLPAFGYGLRYRFGMFAQSIEDGRQVERPDDWLRDGDLWMQARPGLTCAVGFGGRVVGEGSGRRWLPAEVVQADACDFVVPAHAGDRVATLRLWQARPAVPLDFGALSRGDLAAAGAAELQADALTWVLYPDDSTEAGRVLRLKQETLLVSASLQDLIARHLAEGGRLHALGLANAIHLNDTHPALAPAELMRLLVDEHGLGWDEAWSIVRQATSYTNHTLMPEALETWPLRLFEALLPRHLEIIYEINQRLLDEVRARVPGDDALVQRMSLIDERGERRVRMAGLAVVASHRVNGVAALHSELMQKTLFADHARLFPGRFLNVTNGVTPRRWLQQANAPLSALLDETLGSEWRRDLGALARLRPLAGDAQLGARFLAVKRLARERLAARIRRDLGIVVDPASLFDVQVKRIHEYKRQLLNLLQVVARYQAILERPEGPEGRGWVPRTVILAGKAASAYQLAKQVIQLAHDIARVVNADPRVGGALKLVFLPNYGVSLAESIMPAADLSQQISTAGTEASGTGNMKLALNGACTLGTWDGATIEMAEAIGADDLFLFGLRAEAIEALQRVGYDPRAVVAEQPALGRVLDAIARGAFSPGEPARHRGLIDGLLNRDRYFLLADFAAYAAAHSEVDAAWRDRAGWAARSLRNIAGMGRFSTDRTVSEYAAEVWSVERARAVAAEELRRRHAG